jgi:putative SOS response-associated peptidase YedK
MLSQSQKGNWIKVVPKVMRRSMLDAASIAPELAAIAAAAEAQSVERVLGEITFQTSRQAEAKAKLACVKPTENAENDLRVSTNKIEAAQRKLDDIAAPTPADGMDRIWPGHFAPVLIRNPETGERRIVPMRYRCRLPGWDEAKEIESPERITCGETASRQWRKVFGVYHGVMVVDRFYADRRKASCCMPLDIHRAIRRRPWFHSFAAITHHLPPEVAIAGHDRCIVSLQEDDLDVWLNPTASTLSALQAILDRGESVHTPTLSITFL